MTWDVPLDDVLLDDYYGAGPPDPRAYDPEALAGYTPPTALPSYGRYEGEPDWPMMPEITAPSYFAPPSIDPRVYDPAALAASTPASALPSYPTPIYGAGSYPTDVGVYGTPQGAAPTPAPATQPIQAPQQTGPDYSGWAGPPTPAQTLRPTAAPGGPKPLVSFGTQAAQQAAPEVTARATPGSPSQDRGWWDAFTAKHKGVTPDVFYSQRRNWKPGSKTWQDNLAYDTVLQSHFRAATGKSSMEPEDWTRAYWWDRAGGRISGPGGQVFFQYDPMSPRFLPTYGPRRGYGTPRNVPPGETPPGQVAPTYEIEATPLPGLRGSFRVPEMALGQIGAPGRGAFEQGLRYAGWSPTGTQGAYGWGEYGRTDPASVWFPPEVWGTAPGAREAQWLSGELGWGGRIPRP